MKFLILNRDYPDFLEWLYEQHPRLEERSYEEQMHARNESLFGVADFYSTNLEELGHSAREIHVNNEFLQKAWAREHGIIVSGREWKLSFKKRVVPWFSRVKTRSWMYRILKEQIQEYKPDVVFNQEMPAISTAFLKEIKPVVKLIIGLHAATQLPESENWNVYDLVLSSFPPTLEWFRSRNIPAELNRLGFEPRILSRLTDGNKKNPVSFVGTFLYPYHSTRVEWLEYLCERLPVRVWSPNLHQLNESSPIHKVYAGSIWGLEMYQALRDSVVTLNHHGSIPAFANNMRLYEATGVGTLLITDWKPNLDEMFEPGKEVITYRSNEECAERIQYYLDHRKEREEIEQAGQKRTLKDHTYIQRAQEIVDLVEGYWKPGSKA